MHIASQDGVRSPDNFNHSTLSHHVFDRQGIKTLLLCAGLDARETTETHIDFSDLQ